MVILIWPCELASFKEVTYVNKCQIVTWGILFLSILGFLAQTFLGTVAPVSYGEFGDSSCTKNLKVAILLLYYLYHWKFSYIESIPSARGNTVHHISHWIKPHQTSSHLHLISTISFQDKFTRKSTQGQSIWTQAALNSIFFFFFFR